MKIKFVENKTLDLLLSPVAQLTKTNAVNSIKNQFADLKCDEVDCLKKESQSELNAEAFYNEQPYYRLQLNTYCCEVFKNKGEEKIKSFNAQYKREN